MKAEELMIGDWVYAIDGDRKKHPCRIATLEYDSTNERDDFSIDFYGTDYEVEWPDVAFEVEPIPLTPEILEKNGFSGEGYNMGIIGFHTAPIPEVKDGYEVFIWKDMCLEIKHGFTHLKRYTFYVHELQHALKLCGIEKQIVI